MVFCIVNPITINARQKIKIIHPFILLDTVLYSGSLSGLLLVKVSVSWYQMAVEASEYYYSGTWISSD